MHTNMTSKSKAYLIGGGIGSLAGAALMIRDVNLPGRNISILEATPILGGSLDAAGDAERGYAMPNFSQASEESLRASRITDQPSPGFFETSFWFKRYPLRYMLEFSRITAPAKRTRADSGGWTLWDGLAAARPQFGRPEVFNSSIVQAWWESFTVTLIDPAFFNHRAQFSGNRIQSDRPYPVPAGSKNLAFVRQFVEIPEDVVCTVDYSIRAAQMAGCELMGGERKVPIITPHAKSGLAQFEALLKAFK